MAKQAVSGIERHVEKIVVGLAGAVLVGAITMYLAKSPRKVSVGRQELGPGDVDPAVHQIAEDLKSTIAGAKHTVYNLPDPVEKLNQQSENPLGSSPPTLRAPLAWRQPSVPEVTESSDPTKVKLAPVVPPESIAVSRGRTSIRPLEPAAIDGGPKEEEGEQEDHFWVAVAAEFDIDKQTRAFNSSGYLSQRSDVQIAGVALQRRRLLPGGKWGDWEDVNPFSPYRPVVAPTLELTETQGNWVVDQTGRQNLATFATLIRAHQDRISRPLPPTYVGGDKWELPSLENVDVEGLVQSAKKGAPGVGKGSPEEEKIELLNLSTPKDLDLVKEQLNGLSSAGRHNKTVELAEKYLEKAEKQPRTQARRTIAWLRSFVRDEQRNAERALAAAEKEKEEAVAGNRIAIWVYDTSGTPGELYQYRIAAAILNGYAGVPHMLADPQDAAKTVVQGQWSAASDPVRVPEDTRFFLARVSKPDEATIEVWKWKRGQWRSDRFNVSIGETIGHRKRNRALDMQLDYSTGAAVVQIEEARKVRLTPMNVPSASYKDVREVESAALIYMDVSGRLGERIAELDSNDPWRRNRKKEGRPRRRAAR